MAKRKGSYPKNKSTEEWVADKRNYPDALKFVDIKSSGKPQRVPVKNMMCPRCKNGWAFQFGAIAILGNIVYHKKCLSGVELEHSIVSDE